MNSVPELRELADGVVDVALRDGSVLHVRPVVAADAPAMHAFFDALSLESIGLRFFGVPNVDWVTKWAVGTDHSKRYMLVATTGPGRVIVAHGAYVRIDGGRAEVAFVVADAWQGHGIATILLCQLASVAQLRGIASFRAEVLPGNHRMIAVFRDSGFPVKLRTRGGVTEVELLTSLSGLARERAGGRGYGDALPAHLHLAQAPAGPERGAAAERAIRVVLAEDHAQMRRSLRLLLDREDGVKVVAEAADLATVMRHLRAQRPHVLVLDLRLPEGSSVDAIASLRKQSPSTEIVVVTMEESPAFAQQAFAADAIGFVLKDTADAELPEAVRRAARRERYISPRVAGRFTAGRRVVGAADARIALRRGLGGS